MHWLKMIIVYKLQGAKVYDVPHCWSGRFRIVKWKETEMKSKLELHDVILWTIPSIGLKMLCSDAVTMDRYCV